MIEWHPITTALKDGTPVLIAIWDGDNDEPDALVGAHWAKWADREGWYANGFPVISDHGGGQFPGNGAVTDNGYHELEPTHWARINRPKP